MKIGLVCPYDLFRGGGVQEHILAQHRELTRRGHEVRILTPRPRKNHNQPPKDMLFVGNSAQVKTPISTSLELGISMERKQIDSLLEAEQFDLLHVHEPEVPLLGSQIIARAQVPIVATFHAIHPETRTAKTIEALRVPYSRSIFSKINAMTAVSDVAAGFARSQTEEKIRIIPNGIDLKKYRWSDKKDKNVIVYVGRLERRKGVKYLLCAFERLVKLYPELELRIIGDGPLKKRLQDLVRSHHIPNVSFLGFISDTEKIEQMRSASLFVSPALFGESFGIVLLEAMALGTPLVAGDNPGYASVMRGSGKLSLTNPRDERAFVRSMEMLLQEEPVRELWLEWAKGYIQQFDYRQIVDQYEAIYRELIS